MTLSRWHEDLAAHDEAFACLQDLLDPSSFATTVVKAFREWGQGLLRLATALVRENAALERENATLRDRIAELERSAALDSTTSSKPPASDGLRKKSGTQRRTRSQRGKSGRPAAASRATRERRWRGPRARTMLWIMTPPPVRAAAHRCRTPTVTARPSVDRSSMCPSHAPWRSPNTAPIAASAAPAPP